MSENYIHSWTVRGLLPWTPKELRPCGPVAVYSLTLRTSPRPRCYGMAGNQPCMYNSFRTALSNRSRVRDRLLNTVELRSFRDGLQTEQDAQK